MRWLVVFGLQLCSGFGAERRINPLLRIRILTQEKITTKMSMKKCISTIPNSIPPTIARKMKARMSRIRSPLLAAVPSYQLILHGRHVKNIS